MHDLHFVTNSTDAKEFLRFVVGQPDAAMRGWTASDVTAVEPNSAAIQAHEKGHRNVI
jgi:hypothetical protein